jgi:hypothetical protein
VLATQHIQEVIGGIKIASLDEATPLSFEKVALSAFLEDV